MDTPQAVSNSSLLATLIQLGIRYAAAVPGITRFITSNFILCPSHTRIDRSIDLYESKSLFEVPNDILMCCPMFGHSFI